MTNASIPRPDSGYTLLELLVATALVAFLSAGLAANMGTGARIWEVSEDRSLRQSEIAIVETTLGRHLSLAVPGFVTVNSRAQRTIFEGDRVKMRFLTSAGTAATGGGIFAEEIEIRPGADGAAASLIIRRARTALSLGSPDASTPWDESVIPLGADTARFGYFGSPGGEGSEVWRDSWDETTRQPLLVGLFFSGPDGSADVRDIMVAPRRNQPSVMLDEAALDSYMSGAGN